MRRIRLWIVIGAAALPLAIAAVAFAVAPSATTFVRAQLDAEQRLNTGGGDGIKFQTKGPTDVAVQEVTYPAGAASTWHHHPGFVLVAIQSGTITIHEDCSTRTLSAPATFVETGDATVWRLENLTASDVKLYAAFVVPTGAPLRIDTVPQEPPAC